jgi:hypothetical protein
MKKNEIRSPDLIEVKPHITEVLNDHPVVQWIVERQKMLLSTIAAIIVGILILSRFFMGAPGQKEANLITTETEFLNLQRAVLGIDPEISIDDTFAKINQLLTQYPELKSKYDAPLAQAFITVKKPNDAQAFAEESLKRTQANNLSLYQDFAQTTLLISQEKFEEALTKAQKLKDTLIQEAPNKELKFGSTLFAYNLMRIALLNQTLVNKTEELNAWREWNEYTQTSKNGIDSKAFIQITSQLEGGNIRLTDYIAQRERELNSLHN